MERIPEPELMDEANQAQAYAHADFEEPHSRFIELFRSSYPGLEVSGQVLDLGCGPADITLRFARAFPACQIDGLDGAEAMLGWGREAVRRSGLEQRVRLVHDVLPGNALGEVRYDVIISNSLLHHLHRPAVLWETIKAHAAPEAHVFVMDLRRPASVDRARALTLEHAWNEPDVLQRDFFNSLLASFEVGEVEAQLRAADLRRIEVRVVSDRHLIAFGRISP